MSRIASLWAALVVGLLSTFVIPATAWADESGLDELTKRRGGFGFFGALCCLVVVGVIVLVVFLVMKSRKR